ncbi:hypothetical protein CDAR_419471 [Caerostris darwini]|uniref:Uncharacterized protein n=1 Tax=Caerostris darwini TaxID=1538125 RepID=A0AAV4PVI7_9ARAC|nr:hypothetical protein CDAR_419471 [Caerostris darwini]
MPVPKSPVDVGHRLRTVQRNCVGSEDFGQHHTCARRKSWLRHCFHGDRWDGGGSMRRDDSREPLEVELLWWQKKKQLSQMEEEACRLVPEKKIRLLQGRR